MQSEVRKFMKQRIDATRTETQRKIDEWKQHIKRIPTKNKSDYAYTDFEEC